MSEQNLQEIWQVEVGGQIYEAAFGELHDWINEGSLQPDDKVRKGNLRWIEAKRVPSLVPFFNAKAANAPMPVVTTTTVGTRVADVPEVAAEPAQVEVTVATNAPPKSAAKANTPDGKCANHPDLDAFYACGQCGAEFCKSCPTSYGGSVRICLACGMFCRQISESSLSTKRPSSESSLSPGSFGLSDLVFSFKHPFSFKASLIFGGLMFMVFTLGQSAASIGSIFLAGSALICLMLANMLTFGILANTVDNFAKGELAADFMPAFEDFSIWEDVLQPFFLSIAAYLVSFGPFLATLVIGAYLVLSSVASHVENVQADLQRIPGTPYYSGIEPTAQSDEVRKLIDKANADRERQIAAAQDRTFEADQGTVPDTSTATAGKDAETIDQERLWEEVQQMRQEELKAMAGDTAKEESLQMQAFLGSFLALAAPLVVIGAICLLWGLFFFPAACAVAGYTRSFAATINPMVGLDTIRRLGGTYVKVLAMCFVLLVISGVTGAFISLIFSPFDLPRLGNIPATAVSALVTFYLSIVFSCIVGLALYKKADKLKLPR